MKKKYILKRCFICLTILISTTLCSAQALDTKNFGQLVESTAYLYSDPVLKGPVKTYTIQDVGRSPLTLVADSSSHTINGITYKATSMQGMNVGSTFVYTVKIETKTKKDGTGTDGDEVMACMWRTNLLTKEKKNCVFQNEGSQVFTNYSTDMGHANDIVIRKYRAGTDDSAANHIFSCTLNSDRGIARLKYIGDNSAGKAQYKFGGYYRMVDSKGNAFAPGAMRYIFAQTIDNVTYNYFLCKNDMDFLICRIPYSDEGGSKFAPHIVYCFRVFSIDTRNAYFSDKDGKGTPGTIDQLQSWTNQGFYYNVTENSIYVPLFNPNNVNQSIILVYNMAGLLSEANLTQQIEEQLDQSRLIFPSLLNFQITGNQKYEIEAVGFATGARESTSPLYFNTNSVVSYEGIWYFDKYICGSELACIANSVIDNPDGTKKPYYTIQYFPNGGFQDTSVSRKWQMNATTHVDGIETQLRKNTFIFPGYSFGGWTLVRQSDEKVLCQTSTGMQWYKEEEIPVGCEIVIIKDCTKIDHLSPINGDTIKCIAQWDKNTSF